MKYVLEIKPEYEDSFKGLMILGAKDSNLFVDMLGVENLEELNADYINEHFGDLQEQAYQKGFENGKAVHERGCEGCKWEGDASTCSPCERCCNCYHNEWTAKDDKIEVGDEVKPKANSDWKGLVVGIDGNDIVVMASDGYSTSYPTHLMERTGRHFDITSILEDMRK